MNTAITVTLVICITLVMVLGMFLGFSFVLNRNEREKDIAYWKGFADAIKLEKEEKHESKVDEL